MENMEESLRLWSSSPRLVWITFLAPPSGLFMNHSFLCHQRHILVEKKKANLCALVGVP